MAISYNLAANPIWYFVDLAGNPLIGGEIAFYRSENPSQKKLVYQDAAGTVPYPNPVLISGNGTAGPFYFEFNDANPEQLYYIRVTDEDGNLIWDINNFSGEGGSGGAVVTTALDLENLILNNVMWRNIGTSVTPLPEELLIAPGAHAGFGGTGSPDIRFIKSNTSAADQITFPAFTSGSNPLTGDVCPANYFQYDCNNTPALEAFKYIQFPVNSKLQTLANQDVTVTIWAAIDAAGANEISFAWRQFYGDGSSATAPAITDVMPVLELDSNWKKFTINQITIPNNTGTVGQGGNDALYLLVKLPLNLPCHIKFTKPSLYLGDISPEQDFHSYDYIDSQINAPRTGHVITGYLNTPLGYVAMNDGSIGNASSNATTRANIDTWPLFYLIWNGVSNTYAQLQDSSGDTRSRGVSAIADFQTNHRLVLPHQLGRAICGFGAGSGLSNRALGEITGVETVVLSEAQMPSHNHAGSVLAGVNPGTGVTSAPWGRAIGTNIAFQGNITGLTIAENGDDQPHQNMQPSVFQHVFIKL